jgi:hypothetical protein
MRVTRHLFEATGVKRSSPPAVLDSLDLLIEDEQVGPLPDRADQLSAQTLAGHDTIAILDHA